MVSSNDYNWPITADESWDNLINTKTFLVVTLTQYVDDVKTCISSPSIDYLGLLLFFFTENLTYCTVKPYSMGLDKGKKGRDLLKNISCVVL